MFSNYNVFWGVLLGFLGLHFVEVDPTLWKSVVSGKFAARKAEIFKFLTDTARTPEVKNKSLWNF